MVAHKGVQNERILIFMVGGWSDEEVLLLMMTMISFVCFGSKTVFAFPRLHSLSAIIFLIRKYKHTLTTGGDSPDGREIRYSSSYIDINLYTPPPQYARIRNNDAATFFPLLISTFCIVILSMCVCVLGRLVRHDRMWCLAAAAIKIITYRSRQK